jgi:hypothetical protein
MKIEDLNNLAGFFSRLPVGQKTYQQYGQQSTGTQHSTQNSRGTTTAPGNMLGGLFSGLGAGLGATQGMWKRPAAVTGSGSRGIF